MTNRLCIFVGISFLAGLFLSSNLSSQVVREQASQGAAKQDGPLQMTTMGSDLRAYIVVFNPASGECWVQDTSFSGWRNLGSPASVPDNKGK